MLSVEDKKLYGVIFHQQALFILKQRFCEIKQVVMKLENAVTPGGQMKQHEHFKTGAS